MSYHDLLNQFGYEQESAEQRVYIYCQNPKKLNSAKDIEYNDRGAAQNIARLEKLIDDLKDYRQALAARYAQLETMAYTDRLELERYPSGSGIFYYVRIVRNYEDGTTDIVLNESYAGKERRKAINRFEELKNLRPGIKFIMDIERRSWER